VACAQRGGSSGPEAAVAIAVAVTTGGMSSVGRLRDSAVSQSLTTIMAFRARHVPGATVLLLPFNELDHPAALSRCRQCHPQTARAVERAQDRCHCSRIAQVAPFA